MKGFNKKIDYLCFTANTTGSTVSLRRQGSPTSINLETSTDGSTWTDYTIGDTITLNSIGDKIYFRNKSETTTGFSTGTSSYYYFKMNGSINASGDINYLLNKDSTDTLINYTYQFANLFYNCSALITPPRLPATYLSSYCYYRMFYNCTSLVEPPELPSTMVSSYSYVDMFRACSNLEKLPKLLATQLSVYCYSAMFQNCSKIKLSDTQTGEYQTPYRIPIEGTGIPDQYALNNMFKSTGGTFTGTPTINTTYYTSNTVI